MTSSLVVLTFLLLIIALEAKRVSRGLFDLQLSQSPSDIIKHVIGGDRQLSDHFPNHFTYCGGIQTG